MARNFDSLDDYLEATTDSSVNGLAQYSIFHWATRESAGEGSYGNIAFKGSSSSPNRYWRWQNDASWGLVFIVEFSTTQGAWSISYPDTAWHNYLITYDTTSTSNDPTFYKDGSSEGYIERLTPAGTLATDNTELNIGSNTNQASTWDGSICEFAIWNRELTATEASILGSGYSPLFITNGLVFYSPIHGKSSPEIEYMQGTDLTVSGAVYDEHPRIIYPTSPDNSYIATAAAPSVRYNIMNTVGM